jgi:hypothetical protein
MLGQRANEGNLNTSERSEYVALINAADSIAILKLKARRRLEQISRSRLPSFPLRELGVICIEQDFHYWYPSPVFLVRTQGPVSPKWHSDDSHNRTRL